MPSSPGGIKVSPNGQTAVVTFTLPDGSTPVAYSSKSGAGTISLPATVISDTTFWFQERTVFGVSALVGSQQSATSAGTTASVDLSGGGVAGLTVAVVRAQTGSLVARVDVLRKTAAALRDPNRYVHPSPPTITVAANQTASAFSSGTFIDLLANTAAQAANVEFTNGVPTVVNANSTDFIANRVHVGADVPFRFTVETDADTVELYVRLISGTGSYYRILVDGQLITGTSDVNLTGTSGQVARITLAFATAEPRRIDVDMHLLQYRTVRVLKTRDVWRPTRPRPLTTLVYGDSISYGTGATTPLTAWPYTFGRQSGLGRNIIVNAEGGTGYLAPGPGGQGNEVIYDRITRNATQGLTPDLIVMAAGINDSANAGFTSAALTAEVRRCLQLIKATWPKCPVILLGTFFPNFSVSNTIRDNITAANAAVLAAATESNVIGSVDMSGWITTDNAATYISGDSTHPTQTGHDFYGNRVATSVRTVLDTAAAA